MSGKLKQNSNQKMRVKFSTLGCKVNQYETQALREEFQHKGALLVEHDADLYVINTCTVTKQADAKSREMILRAKRENPHAKIVLCGCLAQQYQKTQHTLPIDYLIPQEKKQDLVNIVLSHREGKKNIWDMRVKEFINQRAFVKIQDGCDHSCSFCKIPLVRGPSRSRRMDDIIAEITRLSRRHKEVVLCGINLGLYGKEWRPKIALHDLLLRILDIPHLARVRLSSIEPAFISDQLLALFTDSRVCPHLHLPFQSGDDDILALMRKPERVATYYRVVNQARGSNPSIAISCDIMVGFPHEEERHFNNTLSFLDKIRPMRTHIFTFSPREGTVFEKHPLKNPQVVKERQRVLKERAELYAREYKEQFIGKPLHMITEEVEGKYILGYTENYIRVHIDDRYPRGELLRVQIKKVDEGKVYADVLEDQLGGSI